MPLDLGTQYIWVLTFLGTFIVGIIIIRPLKRKLKEEGFVGRDMYKLDKPPVAEMGGIIIVISLMAGILIIASLSRLPYVIYLTIFVLLLYFFFGLVDDILGISGSLDLTPQKIAKVVVPLFFAYPLAHQVDNVINLSFFGEVGIGILYPIIFLPVYIMVSANLMNMYSYYNGQSSGTTLIILAFATFRLYTLGRTELMFILFPFLGATLALLSYNYHPAGMFPGDCGDLLMGAMIGITATVGNLELFVFIALLPLTLNFLMVLGWLIKEGGEIETRFGEIDAQGHIDPPNRRTLMWLFPSYLPLTERQTTYIMWSLVLLSSLAAWLCC